jgi:predicted transcriptional regulator
MMLKIDFNTESTLVRIKQILDTLKIQPMTTNELSVELGISAAGLRPYITHLRDSKFIKKHSMQHRAIVYKGTGIYSPPDNWMMMSRLIRLSKIKPFRDELCIAFYGNAKVPSHSF